MLLPTNLLPSALGIVWGLSPTECIARLNALAVFRAERWIELPLLLAGRLRPIDLFFYDPDHLEHYRQDTAGNRYDVWGNKYDAEGKRIVRGGESSDAAREGLYRIATCLYRSQLFFHADPQDADVHATRDRVSLEYQEKYEALVSEYSTVLGSPDFSGAMYVEVETANGSDWTLNPAFPAEYEAIHLTYWSHREGRLLIELQQEDTELPLTIYLACWLTKDSL